MSSWQSALNYCSMNVNGKKSQKQRRLCKSRSCESKNCSNAGNGATDMLSNQGTLVQSSLYLYLWNDDDDQAGVWSVVVMAHPCQWPWIWWWWWWWLFWQCGRRRWWWWWWLYTANHNDHDNDVDEDHDDDNEDEDDDDLVGVWAGECLPRGRQQVSWRKTLRRVATL